MDQKEESSLLEQFRSRIYGALDSYSYTDEELLGFLRAKKMDLLGAEKMLREHLSWREKWRVDKILEEWAPPDVIRNYFPLQYIGHSKDGFPVLLSLHGRIDFRGILSSMSVEDYLRNSIHMTERGLQDCRKQSAKLGKPIKKIVIICDMEGLSFHQMFYKQGLEATIKTAQMYEALYHGLFKKLIVINAPRVFTLGFSVVKPFLADETKAIFRVFGSDSSTWIPALLDEVDADVLPRHWGGNRTDDNGDAYCRSIINMGGEVPKSYYINNRIAANRSNDKYKKSTIDSRSQVKLDFNVTDVGSTIQWDFFTKSGDIGFGIILEGEEYVVEMEKINAEAENCEGEYRCSSPGKYTVVFDNSYSRLRSKHVYHSVHLENPVQS